MGISAGFILLHRQITNWEWYQNPNTFRVFIHCLLMANFADGKFEGHEIRRGQFVTSLPSLAKQTSLSIQQVRTALNHLEVTGDLPSKAYSKFRIITIVKYGEYQQDNRQNNRQSTGNQQASNSQSTGNQQQYNNNNNNNQEIIINDDDYSINLSDGEVAQRIREDQQIEEAALSIGLTVSASSIQKARDLSFRYGINNLLHAIKSSVDVPKWSYVEGILRKMKQDEAEVESGWQEHNEMMKQVLINRGEWDEEYQCSSKKADGFRERGISPTEALEEMERERVRRERCFNRIASQRGVS